MPTVNVRGVPIFYAQRLGGEYHLVFVHGAGAATRFGYTSSTPCARRTSTPSTCLATGGPGARDGEPSASTVISWSPSSMRSESKRQ